MIATRISTYHDEDSQPYDWFIDPATGATRILNLRASSAQRLMAAKPYSGPILSASDVADFDRRPSSVKIKDQDSRGACNGHATATAVELDRALRGMTPVPLSAWYPYAILCNGRDVGSSISDALDLIKRDGVAPESTVPYGTINPNALSAEAHAAAARFRLEVGESLTTWDQILSAVAVGRAANLSIRVGAGFNNLDSEGVPGVGRGPGNHAVCVGGAVKTSSRWGKLILMWNSWGTSWGQDGFCWLSEAHINAGWGFEAFVVQAVGDDPTDPTNPPHA